MAGDGKVRDVNLESCVVCVESLNGWSRGAGFVVGPALAVTCVHAMEVSRAGAGGWVRQWSSAIG
jgi:hypothetical protein